MLVVALDYTIMTASIPTDVNDLYFRCTVTWFNRAYACYVFLFCNISHAFHTMQNIENFKTYHFLSMWWCFDGTCPSKFCLMKCEKLPKVLMQPSKSLSWIMREQASEVFYHLSARRRWYLHIMLWRSCGRIPAVG